MRLHVFGDSHSAFCFDRVPCAEVHWIGPRTMYRFSTEVVEVVKERAVAPVSGDVFVFVFGEIDVRCHLLKVAERTGKPVESVIDTLVEGYVSSIGAAMNAYPGCRAVVMQPPFPSNRKPNPEFPFVGTIDQRIQAHSLLSKKLKSEAILNGLLYLQIPGVYLSRKGTLRKKYSDGGVHIMPMEAGALVDELGRLIGQKLSLEWSWYDIFRRRLNYYVGGSLRRRGGLHRNYQH